MKKCIVPTLLGLMMSGSAFASGEENYRNYVNSLLQTSSFESAEDFDLEEQETYYGKSFNECMDRANAMRDKDMKRCGTDKECRKESNAIWEKHTNACERVSHVDKTTKTGEKVFGKK